MKWTIVCLLACCSLSVFAQTLSMDSPYKLLQNIADQIEAKTNAFPHFKKFSADSIQSSQIYYENNIQHKPNPNYAQIKASYEQDEKEGRARLRPALSSFKMLDVYPKRNGIRLQIQLFSTQEAAQSQSILQPYIEFGDWLLEVSILGAQSKEMTTIRAIVHEIIDEQVAKYSED